MKKHILLAAISAFFTLGSPLVRATPIDITAGVPGALSPSLPGETVLGFDDLPIGALPSYQFDGGTISGSDAIEDTTLIGKYAQPAGDTTNYLTVSYPSAVGAVTFGFTTPENYFGIYWGSLDNYNSITFLQNHQPIATFSGTAIARLAGLAANGDQQSPSSNRYINFNLGDAFYDEVILSTTDFGFEVDNVAFGDPPAPISEPATVLLLVSSVYGLALVRRAKLSSVGLAPLSSIRPRHHGRAVSAGSRSRLRSCGCPR
jgi:hypothetical protein